MDTRRQMDLPMWKGSQDRKGQIPEPIPGYPLLRCLLVSRRGLVRYGYGSCWASTASVRLPTYQCYNMSSNDGDRKFRSIRFLAENSDGYIMARSICRHGGTCLLSLPLALTDGK
ncbi:hypothetical protein HL42_4368 [Trichophyton rubrum]|nr:hypothetical protein HL42_4368 [Trichophyton rubrum]